MYDLHWDEDGADAAAPNERAKAAFQFAPSAADASSLAQRTATVEKVPETLEVEDGAQVARVMWVFQCLAATASAAPRLFIYIYICTFIQVAMSMYQILLKL